MLHHPNRLQALRTSRGWTQADLAEIVQVTKPTISRWEQRESGISDLRRTQLAAIFGVNVAHLMYWDQPSAAPGQLMLDGFPDQDAA